MILMYKQLKNLFLVVMSIVLTTSFSNAEAIGKESFDLDGVVAIDPDCFRYILRVEYNEAGEEISRRLAPIEDMEDLFAFLEEQKMASAEGRTARGLEIPATEFVWSTHNNAMSFAGTSECSILFTDRCFKGRSVVNIYFTNYWFIRYKIKLILLRLSAHCFVATA